MRAVEPTLSGYAVNPDDGVQIYYEVFGPREADRTIVFLPTWQLVHSRVWKFQVPYFARQGFRVVVYDPRGNGNSDRPATGYSSSAFVGDALEVFRETGVERATFVALSAGARVGTILAAEYPELVERIVYIGQAIRFEASVRDASQARFNEMPPDREGWNKYNAVHWRENYLDFVEWFVDLIFTEPHSTKGCDDSVEWAQETTPEVLIAGNLEGDWPDMSPLAAQIQCPALVIHGSDDQIIDVENAYRLAEMIPDARLVIIDEGGHNPAARDPVYANHLIHDFLGRAIPRTHHWPRASSRPNRALFVSSPIGLGHAQRDLAIADELRALVPGLQIDWLAQPPVTRLLEERGEAIHPMSDRLAGESDHIEAESGDEHELHVFQAIREMDEILLANFFVFLDAVWETRYDIWICDEAWDVDRYLFENPELKTAPYVWLTDVVGYLPADPEHTSEREAYVAADYNAELINWMDRYPSLRDVSLYIGGPEDLLPVPLGPGLPTIPEWTARTHEFTSYIGYFDPDQLPDQETLRRAFDLPLDKPVAVASAGGTAVGNPLLSRIVESWPEVQRRLPDLHLVVVGGPRVDMSALPQHVGIDYRGYVPNLYEMFAAADVALVQGGLSTTMELVGLKKPFLYFPLQQHYEQQRHVAHRLEHHDVPEWARIQFPEATPERIAERLVDVLHHPVKYRPVESGGARYVAERIAPLIQRPVNTRVAVYVD
jgi:pimeloyl-ACP methyl ester carboxylesterase